MEKENQLHNIDSINSVSTESRNNASAALKVAEADLKIAEAGYKPELRRNFTIWSLLGVGFGLTNSWFGISASLITGIASGGPMTIVYGIIIIAVISTQIAISLSELSSIYNSAGGQYYWTFQLAPEKYKRFWAYICGSLAWAGSVFTSASVTMSIATAVVGMWVLTNNDPNFVIKQWHVFITYEMLNILMAVFNIYEKPLPHFAKAALYTSLGSFVVITITVLSCSSGNYQPASFVFSDFNNGTGWSSAGIAFIVGLINPNWSFSCLDCATHMAEEIQNPDTLIPISICATVAIGFVTSWIYSIAMFFSISNLDEIMASNTGVPILDIYYQSLGNKGGAIFLECLVVLTAVGCNIASHTWQARLAWSFARDNGLPGSKYWSKVNTKTNMPINAHLMSCFWCAVVGCIYMGSTTAYNSMVTSCIVFLLLSYAVPIVCLLYKGRDNVPHGKFWLGKFGFVANIVTLFWTLFAVVFYSFPMSMPATKDNMNYVSVITVGFCAYCIIYWYARGRKQFTRFEARQEEAEALGAVLSAKVTHLSAIASRTDKTVDVEKKM